MHRIMDTDVHTMIMLRDSNSSAVVVCLSWGSGFVVIAYAATERREIILFLKLTETTDLTNQLSE